MGLKTTADGIDGLLPHVLEDEIQILVLATFRPVEFHFDTFEFPIFLNNSFGTFPIKTIFDMYTRREISSFFILKRLRHGRELGPQNEMLKS